MADDPKAPQRRNLSADDIVTEPTLSRRRFVAMAGTAAGAAAIVMDPVGEAQAQTCAPGRRTGYNDRDFELRGRPRNGPCPELNLGDYAGYGRSNPGLPPNSGPGPSGTRTNCSDNDPSDQAGYGRRCATPRTGVTDNDRGVNADPPNGGRGTAQSPRTGVTDTDSGPNADPQGGGRGTRGQTQTPRSGCTDQDPSPPRGDPVGAGRRCR